MKLWVLGLILALIPVLNFIIQYFLSKKEKTLKPFKENLICYYLDFIFIPFNFILAYTLVFPLQKLWLFALIAVLINIFFHYAFWVRYEKESQRSYLFKARSKKITLSDAIHAKKMTSAGIMHFIFSTIQTFFILEFFFFSLTNIWMYFNLFILMLFFIGVFIFSSKMHKKILPESILTLVVGILALIAKLTLSFS